MVGNRLDGAKNPLLLVPLAHCSPPMMNKTDLCIQWSTEDAMEGTLHAIPDMAALDLLSLESVAWGKSAAVSFLTRGVCVQGFKASRPQSVAVCQPCGGAALEADP